MSGTLIIGKNGGVFSIDFTRNINMDLHWTRSQKYTYGFRNTDKFSWEKIDNSTPALVLKLENYNGLGIVRSLGKLGIDVYGIDMNKNTPATFSKYIKKSYVWNFEKASEENSIEFLIELSEKIGRPAVLIPTGDMLAKFVAKYKDTINDYFLFPRNSFEKIRSIANKKEMYNLAVKNNIPVPESFFPENLTQLIEFAKNIHYPVLLKGINGDLLEKQTGKKMIIAYDKTELITQYEKMENFENPNLMIQEYIPVNKNNMWIFNGYFDTDSDCLASFTGLKIRQNPIYTGMTSYGVCLKNDTLINQSIKFLEAINFIGPVDIDFIYDHASDSYKMLDVNPRIGASFRLFVGKNGLDIVRATYLNTTRQSIPEPITNDGRKWFVEDKDLLSSYRYLKNKEMSYSEWITSMLGIKEAGYFSLSDPLPFAIMWINHIKKSSSKFFSSINDKFHTDKKGPESQNRTSKKNIGKLNFEHVTTDNENSNKSITKRRRKNPYN